MEGLQKSVSQMLRVGCLRLDTLAGEGAGLAQCALDKPNVGLGRATCACLQAGPNLDFREVAGSVLG